MYTWIETIGINVLKPILIGKYGTISEIDSDKTKV